MSLRSGVPRVSDVTTRRYPNALRYRGITGFGGGWRKPPIFGASLEAFAQRVPCALARRVAERAGARRTVLGFRCRPTRRGYESVAARCTRPGGRVVRFEVAS